MGIYMRSFLLNNYQPYHQKKYAYRIIAIVVK